VRGVAFRRTSPAAHGKVRLKPDSTYCRATATYAPQSPA
jgi:hypothetical protein